MYEYKYVNVIGEGLSATKFREHRDIIDRHASQGWRYVGFVPSHIAANGQIAQIDLVFERAAQA